MIPFFFSQSSCIRLFSHAMDVLSGVAVRASYVDEPIESDVKMFRCVI